MPAVLPDAELRRQTLGLVPQLLQAGRQLAQQRHLVRIGPELFARAPAGTALITRRPVPFRRDRCLRSQTHPGPPRYGAQRAPPGSPVSRWRGEGGVQGRDGVPNHPGVLNFQQGSQAGHSSEQYGAAPTGTCPSDGLSLPGEVDLGSAAPSHDVRSTPQQQSTMNLVDPATADVLSTFATLAATLLALFLAASRPLISRWKQPRLEIRLGEMEPHVRSIRESHPRRLDGAFLRVEVANVGRSDATSVRTVLTRWWERGGNDTRPWVQRDIDPLTLHWAGPRIPLRNEIKLAPGMSDFLDLLVYEPPDLFIPMENGELIERGYRLRAASPHEEQRFRLTAICENGRSCSRVVSLICDRTDLFCAVQFVDEPDSAQVAASSLLARRRAAHA
jgi:hypothetical protein